MSRRDMWALGPTRRSAMHWNGSTWRAQPVPPVTVPGPRSQCQFAQIAATGPRSLWRAYETSNSRTSSVGLARLRGRHWQAVKLPAAITGLDQIAQDGRGAVWLLADVEVNFDSR